MSISTDIQRTNQEKRIANMNYSSHYLLNMQKEPEAFIIKIAGSNLGSGLRNIYTVTVNETARTMSCDCPDSKGWAKHYNCVCKHCCFVLFRICKDFFTIDSDFFKELKFNEVEFIYLFDKLTERLAYFDNFEFLRSQDDIISLELLERYQKIQLSDEDGKKYEPKEEPEKEAQCPICLLGFEGEETEHLECPECKNYLHKDCMEQWLTSGHQTCVYCRSECWKDYFQDYNNGYKHL